MSLNNLKIAQKLLVAFVTILLVTVVSMASVYQQLVNISEARAQRSLVIDIVDDLQDATEAMLNQETGMRGYLLSVNPSFLEPYQKGRADFSASMAHVLPLLANDRAAQDMIGAVKDAAQIWQRDVGDRETQLMSKPETREQARSMVAEGVGKAKMDDVRAAIAKVMAHEKEEMEARTIASANATSFALEVLAFGAVIATLTAAVAGWLLNRMIAKPVSAMAHAMQQLSSGNHSIDVPASGRRDEIGHMAAAVESFKQAAILKEQLAVEAEAARQTAEAVREAAEAEREAAAGRQAEVVEALANGLAKLAEGDLTFTLNNPFVPEYERLRSDFNAAVEGLHSAMKTIVAHTQTIGAGTSEIAGAADDLAKRTEQQAATLEQTAAALDEVTATVRNTASGSSRAQAVAAAAKAEAEQSGKVVGEAVAAMGEIEGSARQIGQIIGVIDEIAFQTNLLALNAGVEAARAGEAGRGFAVVASEVRALAQRAADAAKEIKALISTSMQQVERGVKLVGETGHALGRIQSGVTEINAAISEIAASAQEQSTGLAEVNTAVNQMDQVTQQNAAMVEESTAATHSLSRETEELKHAMARFRMAEAAAPRHAVKPARAPATHPTVQGNLALKPKPLAEPATENWDTF
jgi:methyl-accepting chemotaxis protein